jgi:N-acetylglucosaminyl-diphospho-decaprenol L-rhamnosyltransferase
MPHESTAANTGSSPSPSVGCHAWSLITVTFNSAHTLREFWKTTVLPSDVDWIVVDNASNDDSVEVARALNARVIPLNTNVGFAAANNIGFRSSSARYVGFVNPDVSVEFDSLPVLAEVIEATGGLVAPQLINRDGTPQPNGRGYPFLAEKIRNRIESNATASAYRRFAQSGENIAIVWFIGAVVLGRRDQLESLGPWDERFFLYYEDKDLCLRAAKAGIPRTLTGRTNWVHGWARETTNFELTPWKHELSSLWKFYTRYPRLLSPTPRLAGNRLNKKGWPRKRA